MRRYGVSLLHAMQNSQQTAVTRSAILITQSVSSKQFSTQSTSPRLRTRIAASNSKYALNGVNGEGHTSVKETRKKTIHTRKRQERKNTVASASSSPDMDNTNEMKATKLETAYKDGKPLITVMGLGGAGSNAINNMIASQLEGVEFIVANTDSQALNRSLAHRKITLGKDITKGLGAGSKPQLGKLSAEMQRKEIEEALVQSNMLFITGGMGGGTCTGAAPVVAEIARDMGILTVGVVSTPFRSEGPNRTRLANGGVKELAKHVDTLIIVPNQNLLALSNKSTTMLEAFRYADDVLLEGVKGVTDLIVRPGLINLDFADIKTILSRAGRAIMGSGTSSEPKERARLAAEQALINPLLGDLPTESALGLLVTIRGGEDMTLFEVDEIMDIIRSRVAEDANIIFGTCYDKSLEGSVHVSIIVSGIQTDLISPPVHSMESTTGKPTIGNIGGNRMNTSTATKTTVSTEREEAVIESQRTLFSRLFSL